MPSVTADPLHNKKATARVIVGRGVDYLIGTRENTSKRLEAAVARKLRVGLAAALRQPSHDA